MLTVTLHSETGEKLTIEVKTGWEDVTTAEYIAMQGKTEAELLQWLTGLTPEQLSALEPATAALFADLLTGFTELPEAECSLDIQTEPVGHFETVKSFLRRYYREEPKTARARTLPHVYAAYYGLGAKAVQELPAADVIPVALQLMEQVETVSAYYDKLTTDADEAGTDEAGEDEMAVFGFYPVLHLLSGGDILKHKELMQQSVRVVYTHLFFLKGLAKSQKEQTV